MTTIHDCSQEIKQATLKVTPARIAALRLFESTEKPLDALYLVDHLAKEGIDRVTAFRLLNTFVEHGLLRKLEFREGKFRYELANKEDHHHLICRLCDSVIDVEDTIIPGFVKLIERKHHFLVTDHSLEFFGVCEKCRGEGN